MEVKWVQCNQNYLNFWNSYFSWHRHLNFNTKHCAPPPGSYGPAKSRAPQLPMSLSSLYIKVSKYRKQIMLGVLDSSKKRTKLTILDTFSTQDSELRSFFGRIEDTIFFFEIYWPLVLDFIFTKACRILYMEVFRDLFSEEKVARRWQWWKMCWFTFWMNIHIFLWMKTLENRN